ncbi:MAG: c-type cytochrome [Bacteroidota bacterium]
MIISFAFLSGQCVAQTKVPWQAPATANSSKNPLAGNAASLAEGERIYTRYCSPCHGTTGKGDGIAAVSLNPKPADHTSALIQNETDGSLFWKLSEGRAPMPSYKAILSDEKRWALINYIRTLAKK